MAGAGAMRRRVAFGGAFVAIVALVVAGTVDAAPKPPPPPAVDLVAAVRQNGVCGTFGQSLPPLVIRSGFQPGDRVEGIEVCLRNVGTAKGSARLRVAERVDSETACSAGEAAVDRTCGGAGAGELGQQLVVPFAIRPGCTGKTGSSIGYPFDTLTKSSAPVAVIRPGETWCVVLGLEYRASATEALASQTDRVTWRYAFDIVQ